MTVKIASLESKVKKKRVKKTTYEEAESIVDNFVHANKWKKDQGEQKIVVGLNNYNKIFRYIFLIPQKEFEFKILEVADRDPEDCMTLLSVDYDGHEVGRLEIRPYKTTSSRYA